MRLYLKITYLFIALIANVTFAATTPKVVHKPYFYDPVARGALSLSQQIQNLKSDEFSDVFNSINGSKPTDQSIVRQDLVDTWQKLIYTSQLVYLLRGMRYYFPVGYEVESAHKTLKSWKDFKQGSDAILGIVRGIFGQRSIKFSTDPDKNTPFSELIDDQGRNWNVKVEWAREGEGTATPSGWELNSPPFTNVDELELFSSVLWSLGKSEFGQIADFCGIHENFDIVPLYSQADEATKAMTLINFLLLHEQFLPAIFQSLNVERYGAHRNVFIRPYLYDHQDFLGELKSIPVREMSFSKIKSLQEKYLFKEAMIQIEEHIDDPGRREEAKKNWKSFRQNWKARDVKIKWLNDTALIESRIMDHKPNEPWVAIKGTLIMQLILSRSFELAQEKKIWDLNVPTRLSSESIDQYWERISQDKNMNISAMVNGLGINDKTIEAVLLNRDFKTQTHFSTSTDVITGGFELEFISDKIIDIIVPNDPELRSKWRELDSKEKMNLLVKMGFRPDGTYTHDMYSVITSKFRLDLDKFPNMNIRPHLEESGRAEVMSNGRGVFSVSALTNSAKSVIEVLKNGNETNVNQMTFSFHFHQFVPDQFFKNMTAADINSFVKFIEIISLYLSVADYSEVNSTRPPHRLDSWSLDRYSPKDLSAVRAHLMGQTALSNSDQKYHNIGFRPVQGGVDFELRSAGTDLAFANSVLKLINDAVANQKLGILNDFRLPEFFMEPQDYNNRAEYHQYTLAGSLLKHGFKLDKIDILILNKLQFEIYKPSMSAYVKLPNGDTVETIPSDELDSRLIRTNFESNVALPLQPWSEMPIIDQSSRSKIEKEKIKFLNKLFNLVQKVKSSKTHAFIVDSENFLYLCHYLDRSTHSRKPVLMFGAEADRRKLVLEELVFELRGLVVDFAKTTRLQNILAGILTANQPDSSLLLADSPPILPLSKGSSSCRSVVK